MLGIDPGVSGAYAAYSLVNGSYKVWDFPKDPALLPAHLNKLLPRIKMAVIENITTIYMPRNKKGEVVRPLGLLTFGINIGTWHGILLSLKIPHMKIAPQKWQRAMFDSSAKGTTTKDRSVSFINRRLGAEFKKSHHNRTDALCLALYGSKLLNSSF